MTHKLKYFSCLPLTPSIISNMLSENVLRVLHKDLKKIKATNYLDRWKLSHRKSKRVAIGFNNSENVLQIQMFSRWWCTTDCRKSRFTVRREPCRCCYLEVVTSWQSKAGFFNVFMVK